MQTVFVLQLLIARACNLVRDFALADLALATVGNSFQILSQWN